MQYKKHLSQHTHKTHNLHKRKNRSTYLGLPYCCYHHTVHFQTHVHCNVVTKLVQDKCPFQHSIEVFKWNLYRNGYIYVIVSKLSTCLCCCDNTDVDLLS